MVLQNFAKFAGKYLCQSLLFNKLTGLSPATLLKKDPLAQVSHVNFLKFFKNTFFQRTPLVTSSECIFEAYTFAVS